MNPPHRAKLAARIAEVAGHALSTRQVVTPIEVLSGIGWLPAAQVESWRRGRVAYLERVADANLAKLNTALRLLADWARQHGLTPSETVYVSWTRDRHRLRFTKTGDTHLERAWQTHWISPALTEAKHAQRIRKGATAPNTPITAGIPRQGPLGPDSGTAPISPRPGHGDGSTSCTCDPSHTNTARSG
jgi:hypothetical protein